VAGTGTGLMRRHTGTQAKRKITTAVHVFTLRGSLFQQGSTRNDRSSPRSRRREQGGFSQLCIEDEQQ